MRIGFWTALISLLALLLPPNAEAQNRQVKKKRARPAATRTSKAAPKAAPKARRKPAPKPKPKATPAKATESSKESPERKKVRKKPRKKKASSPAARVAGIVARPLSAIQPGRGIPLALAAVTPGEGIDEDTAAALTLRLEREINRYQSFDLVPVDELAAVTGEDVSPECFADDECRESLTSAGVSDVLTAILDESDEAVTLRLAVYDVQQNKAVVEHAAKAEDLSSLFGEIGDQVQSVVLPLLGERRGHLLVSSSETGATVKLDGEILGTTPLNRIPVTWGPHRLEVSKDGFITSVEEVVVNTPGAIERNVTLIPTPAHLAKYEGNARALRTAAWITTGAAVAAALAAGYFQYDYTQASHRVSELAADGERESERQAAAARASGSLLGARVSGGAAAGLALGAASLWIIGPNPDHYARYREVVSGEASR